ncbi:hypothetical protein HGB07_06750, partial [Candidatus Roizmanbacteria bacterium]|nr:hypothetical protein [Candidatus Roizmanbacteria bacterium]
DVKNRQKVSVEEKDIKKTKYERQTKDGKTQVRYALRAQVSGTKLTKFVSEADWKSLSAPEE